MKNTKERLEEWNMTFKSKRKITMIIMGLIVGGFYLAFAVSGKAPAANDIQEWARAILKYLGITMGIAIVTQILFHIAYAIGVAIKERDTDDENVGRIVSATVVEDEMDKVVEMKSSIVGYVCLGVGTLVMLIVLAVGFPFIWAVHVQLGAVMVASLIEGFICIYLYERGV